MAAAVLAHHTFDNQCNGLHLFFLPVVFVDILILRQFYPFGARLGGHRRKGRLLLRGGMRRMGFETLEPQCIHYDAHAGKAHGRGADHRVQPQMERQVQKPRRDGDAHRVVKESPEQVLLDVADNGLGQPDGRDRVGKVAFHQHHIGAFDGNVRARADGDPHIRAGQRRRVVDAVSHHSDGFPLLLQSRHMLLLFLRQHLGNDMGDVQLAADGLRSTPVVARQHRHINAHTL